MTDLSSQSIALGNVGRALENIAGGIAERLRQEGSGATPAFEPYVELVDREVLRLRGEGQGALADALAALRDA